MVEVENREGFERKGIRAGIDKESIDIEIFYKGKNISHRVTDIVIIRFSGEEWVV